MLKALKWAYSLGVDQERVRIAAHLERAAHGARDERDQFNDAINRELGMSKPKPKKMEELNFNRAVATRVDTIISGLFESRGQWIESESVLFPDKKGGKK